MHEHRSKRCPRCETVKPAEAFYTDPSKASGLSSRCKECDRAKGRASYRAKPKPQRVCPSCAKAMGKGKHTCDQCKAAEATVPLLVSCHWCEQLFTISGERRRNYEARGQGRTFCSHMCRGDWSSARQREAASETARQRRLPVHVKDADIRSLRHALAVRLLTSSPDLRPRAFVGGPCRQCGQPFTALHDRGQPPRFCSERCMRLKHRHIGKRKRRAALKAAITESVDPAVVYQRDNWTCRIEGCGEPIDPTLDPESSHAASIDHIVPLSLGGTHTYDNIRAAHRVCNSRRGNRVEQLSWGV